MKELIYCLYKFSNSESLNSIGIKDNVLKKNLRRTASWKGFAQNAQLFRKSFQRSVKW